MFTVIVGENASGKTCYLNMLYNRRAEEAIIRPIDISLKSAVFPDSDDLQDATNPLEVGRIIDIMLRKSDILLLDEVESDKHLVYKVAMLVSKAKPVYAVTHDEDITIYADKVCKLNGDALIDLSREEMLHEIYQDEDKYGLSDIYCAYHGYEYLDSLDDIRGADRLQVGTGNHGSSE